MANTEHPAATDAAVRVHDAVARSLAASVPPGATIAVALSGGRDSVVLLDALCACTRRQASGVESMTAANDRSVVAIHVHHGLSPNADAWQRFCVDLCAKRGVPLDVRRIDVPRPAQTSLEGEARRLRYAALASSASALRAGFVALAHHRDDQAETLLLQLLRGAGAHGLAAMSEVRPDARGVTWWRPLLDVPRAAIDTYAQAAGLAFVDDESNALSRHRRNALRHIVMPALASAGFRDPGAALARSAGHQADALRLVDDLAAQDAGAAYDGISLARDALRALAPHRARNLLRWFLRQRGRHPPSTARLRDMLTQLTLARDDAQVRIAHDGAELGVHRGRIFVHAPPPAPFDVAWTGGAPLALRHGTLTLAPAASTGPAVVARRIAAGSLRVRLRAGGERLQLARNRPRRTLKAILQEAGMPAWERHALPLVWCEAELVAVPGIGVAAEWQAAPGDAGLFLAWHPAPV
jgi:tRNA(Ile)-lysidine synthase